MFCASSSARPFWEYRCSNAPIPTFASRSDRDRSHLNIRLDRREAIMSRTIWVGAVAYDPKVVSIWEGMRRYFHEEARLPVEVVLFQSYEAQVAALLALPGEPLPRIDIGWNTNLAFIQADAWSDHRCRPI